MKKHISYQCTILILFQYNITTPETHPSEIRWNLYYMAIYRCGIDLLATIIIPAFLLGYWNFYTHTIMKKRAKILLMSQIIRESTLQSMSKTIQMVDGLVQGNFNFFWGTLYTNYYRH